MPKDIKNGGNEVVATIGYPGVLLKRLQGVFFEGFFQVYCIYDIYKGVFDGGGAIKSPKKLI
ncbi:hypothetical protein DDZ16_16445 [Marinilabilia rubra]|uniref:Uncharacterized protein n=1 Tax=Marinilabilia rubra TaxID=2162893 RepID=A0A2U2B5A1_9BACT|nr:hypothetical protein DDZ16_16445 [Marinilabilia rubra]